MKALQLILQYGTARQKDEVMKEIQSAYGDRKRKSSDTIAHQESEEDDEGDDDDRDSATTLNN
jgi:hypothetical protein